MWGAKLPAPVPLMLAELASGGESFTSADAMAAALGVKPHGGHWNTGLKLLRDNNLAERNAAGAYRLAKELRDG